MRSHHALLLCLLMAGCAVQPSGEEPVRDEELAQLGEWMSGRFESVNRAMPEGESPPRLMQVIRFREADPAGIWLYAVQWTPEGRQPPRRLIYRVRQAEGALIVAELFELVHPGDLPVVPTSEMLDALEDDDFRRRRGCRVWLSRDGLNYGGGTRGRDCMSSYRDAVRIRIELVVRENETVEWLQGFDAEGRLLWGGDAGARVFRRAAR